MTPESLAIKAGMALAGGTGGYFASEAAMSQSGLYPVEKELLTHIESGNGFIKFEAKSESDAKVIVRAVNKTQKKDGQYPEAYLEDKIWACEINVKTGLKKGNVWITKDKLNSIFKDKFFAEVEVTSEGKENETELFRQKEVMRQLVEECSKNRLSATDWKVVGSVTLTETGEAGGKYFFSSNYRLNKMLEKHASSHNAISWSFEGASRALENSIIGKPKIS